MYRAIVMNGIQLACIHWQSILHCVALTVHIDVDHIVKILRILGTPSEEDLECIKNKNVRAEFY